MGCRGGGSAVIVEDARGFNLLKKGRLEKQKTPVGITIFLVLSVAVLWIFYMIAPLRIEEKRLANHLADELKKEEARKVEALKKEAELLRRRSVI